MIPIRGFAAVFLLATGCASAGADPKRSEVLDEVDEPPRHPHLTIAVIDDVGAPARGTMARVIECCHTERGPCGRVPLDESGRVTLDACPRDGFVHVTLTPDPRLYRVPPIGEFEVSGDTTITLTVTRHESALRGLRPAPPE